MRASAVPRAAGAILATPTLNAVANGGQRRRSRRALFLTWLRKTHLYVGLWGAVLGLLFGATGILLNHRAILRLPVATAVQKTVQLPWPGQPPDSPQQLAAWLQATLEFKPDQVLQIKSQPARNVV